MKFTLNLVKLGIDDDQPVLNPEQFCKDYRSLALLSDGTGYLVDSSLKLHSLPVGYGVILTMSNSTEQ